MFFTVDAPAVRSPVDPVCFEVLGWLWLGPQHAQIAAVEAWANNTPIGESSELFARPDVVAQLNLPATTLCGFQVIARCPALRIHEAFDLRLRVRLRDGTRTPPLAELTLHVLPLEVCPLAALLAAVAPDARGLEIGAHAKPVAGLTPYYTDNVASFAGVAGRADFLGSALALPLPDNALDYLCSSHVIEHLSDPIAALLEWHRVLRPGGHLYLVAPDKRFTFDEPRRVTQVGHLLDDFLATPSFERDAPHVREFIYETDWGRLKPGTAPADKPAHQAAALAHFTRELQAGGSVDIHFHTFTPDSLVALLRVTGFVDGPSPRFELVARAERYPADRQDGIGFLFRKRDTSTRRARAPATFVLPHPDNAAPPLPLVCPVTLQPLAITAFTGKPGAGSPHPAANPASAAAGSADPALHLCTRDRRHAYRSVDGVWSLLPPPGARPERPWRTRAWRLARYAAARTRMAFAKVA